MRTRNIDPIWIVARFQSVCSCGKNIRKGDKAFYYPARKRAICETCGHEGANALRAEISMERYGSDCSNDS